MNLVLAFLIALQVCVHSCRNIDNVHHTSAEDSHSIDVQRVSKILIPIPETSVELKHDLSTPHVKYSAPRKISSKHLKHKKQLVEIMPVSHKGSRAEKSLAYIVAAPKVKKHRNVKTINAVIAEPEGAYEQKHNPHDHENDNDAADDENAKLGQDYSKEFILKSIGRKEISSEEYSAEDIDNVEDVKLKMISREATDNNNDIKLEQRHINSLTNHKDIKNNNSHELHLVLSKESIIESKEDDDSKSGYNHIITNSIHESKESASAPEDSNESQIISEKEEKIYLTLIDDISDRPTESHDVTKHIDEEESNNNSDISNDMYDDVKEISLHTFKKSSEEESSNEYLVNDDSITEPTDKYILVAHHVNNEIKPDDIGTIEKITSSNKESIEIVESLEEQKCDKYLLAFKDKIKSKSQDHDHNIKSYRMAFVFNR